ncbi:hypothetical protein B0H13DRAFT_1852072 [Mycena leptocephala]|nr:hypothetical protein B0H13DRAFT_1852072 [Mycena leptocephala]
MTRGVDGKMAVITNPISACHLDLVYLLWDSTEREMDVGMMNQACEPVVHSEKGSKEVTRPTFEQGRNVDGKNTHHSSHQECVWGPLRADGTNSSSVIIDPKTNPVDMAQKRTSICFGLAGRNGTVEPTRMDIIGDQHHLNRRIFQQKCRRLSHPLEHLI